MNVGQQNEQNKDKLSILERVVNSDLKNFPRVVLVKFSILLIYISLIKSTCIIWSLFLMFDLWVLITGLILRQILYS